jgi:ATP adenylyltransferase
MERLWSPWRLEYVTAAAAGDLACIFCRAVEHGGDDSLVLFRGRLAFVILNLYPYTNGHLMVVPNRHVGTLADASREELDDFIELTRRAEIALTEAYQPHGMNVGMNLGRPAGAGVADHIHMHVVPRWNGDTNFMSVVGNVRVLPEDLGHSAARLRPIFARLAEAARP